MLVLEQLGAVEPDLLQTEHTHRSLAHSRPVQRQLVQVPQTVLVALVDDQLAVELVLEKQTVALQAEPQ